MRLGDRMRELRESGRRAFVAYLTAGDPDLGATARFVRALARAGADVVELGVPHSDPVADGPTNRRASERALKSGTTLSRILRTVGELRAGGETVPLVLFTYYNPVLCFGVERFATEAARAGVDGVLLVDLPPEEADAWREILGRAGLDTIFLASPTTRPERLRRIAEASTGFVYYVSRVGVTGARQALSDSLEAELEEVRRQVSKPLCVGFGISTSEQVRAVARLADGVVVGSALVDKIEASRDVEEAERNLESFTRELVRGLR